MGPSVPAGLILCSLLQLVSGNWMHLGLSGAVVDDSWSGCERVPGLVPGQRRACGAQPAAVRAVGAGAARGIHECKFQFRRHRWNCTEQVFEHTLKRGSKETAFIYAITSAGAVHSVTQACSAGNLSDCSCDASRQGQEGGGNDGGWKWGGCSDNVRYGALFARAFVDAPDRQQRSDVRALMNLHNNNAGRLAIARQMELKCRCHGVSGSCELKTCWNKLPSFERVGAFLKKKYDDSVQVSGRARRRLRRRGKRKVPVLKEELVHLEHSPNFCVRDTGKGVLGTAGRACNRSAHAPDTCSRLCCGRGYNTQIVRRWERCHCKFQWCCFVRCKTCEIREEVFTCK